MFLHESDSRTRFRHTAGFLPSLVVMGLVVLLGFSGPTVTKAQEVAAVNLNEVPDVATAPRAGNALGIMSPVWRAYFGEQTGLLLRTGNDAVKEQSLRNLILVARLDRNGIDLSSAVPELAKIVQFGSTKAQRLMALQALSNIGTDHAKESVYRDAMADMRRFLKAEQPLQESNLIHRTAAFVVSDFYSNNGEE